MRLSITFSYNNMEFMFIAPIQVWFTVGTVHKSRGQEVSQEVTSMVNRSFKKSSIHQQLYSLLALTRALGYKCLSVCPVQSALAFRAFFHHLADSLKCNISIGHWCFMIQSSQYFVSLIYYMAEKWSCDLWTVPTALGKFLEAAQVRDGT